jgi:acetyl esterase/lipase
MPATSLEGLPAACIHTAECDPLRDEGAAYAERLERAGVRVSYRCHPGMIHLFYGLKAVIPYAATAFRLMGADISRTLPVRRCVTYLEFAPRARLYTGL